MSFARQDIKQNQFSCSSVYLESLSTKCRRVLHSVRNIFSIITEGCAMSFNFVSFKKKIKNTFSVYFSTKLISWDKLLKLLSVLKLLRVNGKTVKASPGNCKSLKVYNIVYLVQCIIFIRQDMSVMVVVRPVFFVSVWSGSTGIESILWSLERKESWWSEWWI